MLRANKAVPLVVLCFHDRYRQDWYGRRNEQIDLREQAWRCATDLVQLASLIDNVAVLTASPPRSRPSTGG